MALHPEPADRLARAHAPDVALRIGEVATLNRVGQPREVGDVVSFLLSDEASYVNGAKWEIDGGALATIRNDI